MIILDTDFLCVCNKFVKYSDVIEIRHEWGLILSSGIAILQRCSVNCFSLPACPANSTGIHTEIIDGENEDFDERVPLPMNVILPDYQIGYCRACKYPFYWSVAHQRWICMEENIL